MPGPRPPRLRLGELAEDGISPSVFVLLERGAGRRPAIAREARGTVELRFTEKLAPVRIVFTGSEILVEDVAPAGGEQPPVPDLVVSGRLPDIIRLTAAPRVAGVPNPLDRHGRAALRHLARRRIRLEGDRALGRRLLALMALD